MRVALRVAIVSHMLVDIIIIIITSVRKSGLKRTIHDTPTLSDTLCFLNGCKESNR